jgi:hypothetical protein
MVKGERVCGVLLEYQKVDSREFIATHYGTEIAGVMAEATDQILSGGRYLLRSALERSASTSSRLTLLGLGYGDKRA